MYAEINMEGRVVNDPEFKTGKNGEYCTFRMVVNQKLGPQENASFYNCTGNEMIANRIKKAGVKKGRLIHINGEQTLRSYTDREGVERMSADISILNWHYAGTKPKSDEADTPSQNGFAASQRPVGKIHEELTIPGGDEDDDLPI